MVVSHVPGIDVGLGEGVTDTQGRAAQAVSVPLPVAVVTV